mgnify:CR=1 FL=1
MSGIYIHIPFCKRRCIYCDFYSTTGREDIQDRYVDALLKERKLRSNFLNDKGIETLYIGGGTPSVLSPQNIMRLSSLVSGEDIKEYTVECNPDDVTPEFASTLKQAGVSRVSLGIQTFSDNRLSFINRRHNARQAYDAVETMRMAGIENISIDLMYGLPGQTIEVFHNDIYKALELDIPHISAYCLSYEKNTPLYRQLKAGLVKPVSDELCSDMYSMLSEELQSHGFHHYEISNFAKPGMHSKHNSNYWNHTPYIGIGAGAHSFSGNVRSWNPDSIDTYIRGIMAHSLHRERETLSANDIYNEQIMLGLRTNRGIEESLISRRCSDVALLLQRDRLLSRTDDGRLVATQKGLHVLNLIIEKLMIDE